VRSLTFFGVFLAATSISASSFSDEQILCTTSSKPDVAITLRAITKLNRVLDCMSGDFISDLTPCAPNGAYSLSAPTGAAGLVGIVDRWQD
jgi:hypothetical protein